MRDVETVTLESKATLGDKRYHIRTMIPVSYHVMRDALEGRPERQLVMRYCRDTRDRKLREQAFDAVAEWDEEWWVGLLDMSRAFIENDPPQRLPW